MAELHCRVWVFFGGGGLIPLLKSTVVFSCHTITKNPKVFN